MGLRISRLSFKEIFRRNDMWRNLALARVSSWFAIFVLLMLPGLGAYAKLAGGPGSVVFYSARDGHSNNQIYVMNPDGSSAVRITYDTASDVDPDISPNGQQIVFTSNQTETGNNNIFVRDGRGAVTNLTND